MLYENAQEMTEYISKALKQASYEATVLLYSPEIDPFLEDLINLADRVSQFRRRPVRIAKTDCKGVPEDEGSEDVGVVFVID